MRSRPRWKMLTKPQSRSARSGSARVPAIGCPARNRRRADSDDPTGDGGRIVSRGRRGRLRKRRASSSVSRRSSKPQTRPIRSSRSPCSPVAASVHLPAAPRPRSGPCSRTKRLRPRVLSASTGCPPTRVGSSLCAAASRASGETAQAVDGDRANAASRDGWGTRRNSGSGTGMSGRLPLSRTDAEHPLPAALSLSILTQRRRGPTRTRRTPALHFTR